MGNGWSNNPRMISQSPMKHKNYSDPTSHCEISPAQEELTVLWDKRALLPGEICTYQYIKLKAGVKLSGKPPKPTTTCTSCSVPCTALAVSGLEEQYAFEADPSQLLLLV